MKNKNKCLIIKKTMKMQIMVSQISWRFEPQTIRFHITFCSIANLARPSTTVQFGLQKCHKSKNYQK
jgi:hypothetical protein